MQTATATVATETVERINLAFFCKHCSNNIHVRHSEATKRAKNEESWLFFEDFCDCECLSLLLLLLLLLQRLLPMRGASLHKIYCAAASAATNSKSVKWYTLTIRKTITRINRPRKWENAKLANTQTRRCQSSFDLKHKQNTHTQSEKWNKKWKRRKSKMTYEWTITLEATVNNNNNNNKKQPRNTMR